MEDKTGDQIKKLDLEDLGAEDDFDYLDDKVGDKDKKEANKCIGNHGRSLLGLALIAGSSHESYSAHNQHYQESQASQSIDIGQDLIDDTGDSGKLGRDSVLR